MSLGRIASNTLRDVLATIPITVEPTVKTLLDKAITGICLDSRLLKPGECYLAFQPDPQNPAAHGGHYLADAFAAGASMALIDTSLLSSLEKLDKRWCEKLLPVENLSEQVGMICSAWYGQPSNNTAVIGVTGTNGKTSCTWFLAQSPASRLAKYHTNEHRNEMDNHQGAFIGTLGSGFLRDKNMLQWQHASHTTPDALALQQHLHRLQSAEIIAVEISSHALVQQRCVGTVFKVAAFTNLSQDHLDYHGDMETYLEAKSMLFTQYQVENAVVVIDDCFGEQLVHKIRPLVENKVIGNVLTVATNKPADIQVEITDHASRKGLCLKLLTPAGELNVQTRVVGDFNAANLGVVCASLLALGWSLDEIALALQELSSVPGRMQIVGNQDISPAISNEVDQPLVIVDYAHTPAALECLLSGVRKRTADQLWCVVGCGGNRDRGKRPLMAEIASRLADKVVLTSDNPRNEKPEVIISDMLTGVSSDNAIKVQQLPDRKAAIESALQQASGNDCVVIAGKGHEKYQQIGDQQLPFDDVAVASDWLEKFGQHNARVV